MKIGCAILRRVALACVLAACAAAAAAQDGELLEYQQEVGGGIGLTSYIGDASGSPFSNPGLAVSAIWRRNLNARMVVKANLGMGHISGDTKGTFLPTDPNSQTIEGGLPTEVSFSRNLMDIGAQFELNFLGYGLGASYKGLCRWTPYVLAGAGLTLGFGGGGSFAGGMNVPLGVGVKYKVRPRLNVGFEWTFRFTTCDKLDDSDQATKLDDPLGVKSGSFKNKDCYTLALIFVTYDISPKYRKCNN